MLGATRRGFTLLEAMVTLAIMALVAVSAISSYAAMAKLAKQAERDVLMVEAVRIALLYFRTEVRQAGGVGLPAWGSIIVENNCAARGGLPDCRGSDRITLVQGVATYPGCRVVEDLGGRVRFEAVSGSCCFNEAGFVRQAAMVFPGERRATSTNTDETLQPVVLRGVGDCIFEVRPIVAGSDLPRPLAANRSFRDNGHVGATAVLADVKTFYIDWLTDQTGALNMHVDLDGDGSPVGERLTVLEGVADFQAAIGFNVDRRASLETENGAGDAWWPNSVDETGNAQANDDALRAERAHFIGASVIATTKGGRDSVLAQTPWGPVRTLRGLRTIDGTERMRMPE